jgi:hypothetical protein
MANFGEMLNEVSNWEDWRQYEGTKISQEVYHGDANDITGVQTLWVESATCNNLPTGMTQGFLESNEANINGATYRGQRCYGTAAMQTRYFNGGAWSAWQ